MQDEKKKEIISCLPVEKELYARQNEKKILAVAYWWT